MKTTIQEQVLGAQMKSLALARARFLADPSKHLHISSSDDGSQSIKKYNGKDWILNRLHKNGRKTDNIIHALRQHVKLGAKITETVKGKLSLGARIVRVGGVRKIYKKLFTVSEGEKLLKASQCYLSTTAGPMAGLLFISTHNIAFCSDKSIKLSSPNGEEHVRIHYKVTIPLGKIRRVFESENVKNPWEKYIEMVTVDDFEFWFMGFFNYHKTFNCLQEALSQA
ncbi:putative GEM-like protein 8 [Cucurbita pepo subsp. pepo]|uniref:putative GEM-like protein 8 n=1 Tax=Cucurbita pepo subsp. pepo TaxID=3664 RepID=UPI000C9D4372|nr:putative GEM-like protein 8 [Cucurbita pepo subsp. pepo]